MSEGLKLEGVSAGYGRIRAITDISFSVAPGQRIGILGRNGAGKTTTLATIMGLTTLQQGRISFEGRNLDQETTFNRNRRGIGYVPQGREIFPSLTVEENLLAASTGDPSAALEAAYAQFPRLKERRRNGGRQLSGGEQQMLAVARTLVTNPSYLLLDEPLEGLAPQIRDELMDAIRAMTEKRGLACVLVEQHVDAVFAFAETVIVLENGRIIFTGPATELRENVDLLDQAIGLRKTH